MWSAQLHKLSLRKNSVKWKKSCKLKRKEQNLRGEKSRIGWKIMKQISSGPTCLWNTLKDPSQQARNGISIRFSLLFPLFSTNYSHSPWSILSLFFPQCTTTSLWFHAVSLCKAVCRTRSSAKSCNLNRCYRQHQDVNNHNSTPNFPLCGFSSRA